MDACLKRLLIDYEEQEKRFFNEVEDLNSYDLVLHQAQDKVIKILFFIIFFRYCKFQIIWMI